MLVYRKVLFPLLALVSLTPDLWAQAGARGQNEMPTEPVLNRLGLTRRWWSHATLNRQSDKLEFMTADETHLFLQSDAAVVTAFDAESGRHLWSRPVGLSKRVSLQATVTDELLMVINGLTLYGIDKGNGDILWSFQLPIQPSAPPSADKRCVYVGCLDGSVYAFELDKMRSLYAQGLLPEYSKNAILFRFRTSKPIVIPPVPAGPLVAFASTNGSLYSVTIEKHKLMFQFETDAAISAPLVRYKSNLLVTSEDTNFYSLNLRTGRRDWEYTTGHVVKKAPVLVENEVYLLPEYGSMQKLSADAGRSLWPRPVPAISSFLASSAEKVYVADKHNNLTIIARVSGEPQSVLPLERFTIHFTNERSDRIYVATQTGLIMCLHETGRDFPRYHMHPDRAPVLPELAPEGSESEAPPAAEDAEKR